MLWLLDTGIDTRQALVTGCVTDYVQLWQRKRILKHLSWGREREKHNLCLMSGRSSSPITALFNYSPSLYHQGEALWPCALQHSPSSRALWCSHIPLTGVTPSQAALQDLTSCSAHSQFAKVGGWVSGLEWNSHCSVLPRGSVGALGARGKRSSARVSRTASPGNEGIPPVAEHHGAAPSPCQHHSLGELSPDPWAWQPQLWHTQGVQH